MPTAITRRRRIGPPRSCDLVPARSRTPCDVVEIVHHPLYEAARRFLTGEPQRPARAAGLHFSPDARETRAERIVSVTGTDPQQPLAGQDGPTVFVSYRRSDSPSAARQIADALRARFGPERVFFDTRDLRPGTDWHRDIEDRVRAADVVLAVIGPHWV